MYILRARVGVNVYTAPTPYAQRKEADVQNLIIAGYVPRKPELNVTQNGTPVAKFTVGVDEYDSRTKSNTTVWYTVSVWKDLAERCEKWLNKGSKVICTGKPSFRAWADKEGVAQCRAEMTAFTVEFIHGMVNNYSEETTSSDVDAFSPLTEEELAGRTGK